MVDLEDCSSVSSCALILLQIKLLCNGSKEKLTVNAGMFVLM